MMIYLCNACGKYKDDDRELAYRDVREPTELVCESCHADLYAILESLCAATESVSDHWGF